MITPSWEQPQMRNMTDGVRLTADTKNKPLPAVAGSKMSCRLHGTGAKVHEGLLQDDPPSTYSLGI